MKIPAIGITFGLLILICISCHEKSSEPELQSIVSFSSQSSKCLSHGLSKRNSFDSLFTYSFTDSLIIDFSVSANCCPDSNRFNVLYTAVNDTLIITVIDTAAYGCRCICPYLIHAEFGNLPNNHYIVRCVFVYIAAPYLSHDPIYLVNVDRKNEAP